MYRILIHQRFPDVLAWSPPWRREASSEFRHPGDLHGGLSGGLDALDIGKVLEKTWKNPLKSWTYQLNRNWGLDFEV